MIHMKPSVKKSVGEKMAKAVDGQQNLPRMTTQADVDAWIGRLHCFLVGERKKKRPQDKKKSPPNTRSACSRAAEEKLLETTIGHWLAGLEQRLGNAPRWNGIRPAVVITTTPAGIRACKILAEETEFGAVFEYSCYLTEYEYRYWCKEEPDPNLQFHVNYWAWIKTSVPPLGCMSFVITHYRKTTNTGFYDMGSTALAKTTMLIVRCLGGTVRPRGYSPSIFVKVFPPCRGVFTI